MDPGYLCEDGVVRRGYLEGSYMDLSRSCRRLFNGLVMKSDWYRWRLGIKDGVVKLPDR